MKVSMIAAIGKNRELGRGNKLIWHIPRDLKRFREVTLGHPIIMGRKTFESIGRLLPNRTNIIITRDPNYRVEGAIVVSSIEEAIDEAKAASAKSSGEPKEIFIIGGAQIYALGMPYADRLYLTIIDDEARDADAFFPDYSIFKKVISEEEHEEAGFRYKFITLER